MELNSDVVFVGFDVGTKNFAFAVEYKDQFNQKHSIVKKTQINNINELGLFITKNFKNQPFLKNKTVFIGFEDNHWMKEGAYHMWKILNEYNGFIKGMFYGDNRFRTVAFSNNAVKSVAKNMAAHTQHEKDALAIVKLLKNYM